MKKLFLAILPLVIIANFVSAQTVSGPQGYKVIDLGTNSNGDYTQSLILLHEAYNGTPLEFNNVVGTVTAFRGTAGAGNRINVAYINTSSSYTNVFGTIESVSSDYTWKLKTCIYNGKKYMAVDVPYVAAYHNWGFQFAGWANSTGEILKVVDYMVNGQPTNQNVLSNIQDFTPNMGQTIDVARLTITGNVGIGTSSPDAKLAVQGTIHSTEVLVDQTVPTPDYVFDKDYDLTSLKDVKTYIDQNHHLPEIPSAAQVAKNGINLGEMNTKLLKKIEELTLYLIQQNKDLSTEKSKSLAQATLIKKQQIQLNKINERLHIN